MKDTYIYPIGDNLYINLTNRCSNRCTFCVREGKDTYEGYFLWLKEGEPSAEQVVSQIGDPKAYREIVFCGFGEPTERLDALLFICAYVHAHGGRTRLNTNGHGSLLNGRDIAPLLSGAVDVVNISLNAPTKEKYEALCRPCVGGAFEGMLSFARACKREGVECVFSVVDVAGADVEGCRAVAREVGIPLRVREYIS